MDLIEDPTFLSLFAQVQVMDAVLMASLKSHPRPAERPTFAGLTDHLP